MFFYICTAKNRRFRGRLPSIFKRAAEGEKTLKFSRFRHCIYYKLVLFFYKKSRLRNVCSAGVKTSCDSYFTWDLTKQFFRYLRSVFLLRPTSIAMMPASDAPPSPTQRSGLLSSPVLGCGGSSGGVYLLVKV